MRRSLIKCVGIDTSAGQICVKAFRYHRSIGCEFVNSVVIRPKQCRLFTSAIHDESLKRGRSTKFENLEPEKQPTKIIIESFQDMEEHVQTLYCSMLDLKPLPPCWSTNIVITDVEKRDDLYQQNKELVSSIQSAVDAKNLNPSGKHGKNLSVLCGIILKIYNATGRNVFNECSAVLDMLKNWNLDLQAHHYDCTILAAIQDQKWKDASSYFWIQIDIDSKPVDISVTSPVGLYAIARGAKEEEIPAAEAVFDAVLRMSVISPMDQEKYVLAAGTALGLAGEWESSVRYIENSYNSSRLGQTLVAAVMHSCLLCDRFDEALDVFDKMFAVESKNSNANDAENIACPICRDLAMRAMKGSAAKGRSGISLEFLRQINEEGSSISIEALEGITEACEQDKNWEGAASVLLNILDHDQNTSWIVPCDDLTLLRIIGSQTLTKTSVSKPFQTTGKMLASVMRTCNSEGKYGVALLCFRLFESYVPSELLLSHQEYINSTIESFPNSLGKIEQSLAPLIMTLEKNESLLNATMISLNGLGCGRQAATLFEVLQTKWNDKEEEVTNVYGKMRTNADDCYQSMLVQVELESSIIGNKWQSAHRHIHRLTAAIRSHKKTNKEFTASQWKIMKVALERTIQSCTAAGQPEVGIYIFRRFSDEVSSLEPNMFSAGSTAICFPLNNLKFNENMISDDSLLAETILALHSCNRDEAALDLFYSNVKLGTKSFADWTLSCNASYIVLANMNMATDAISLFKDLVKTSTNLETLSVAARVYAMENQLEEIEKLYRHAQINGLLSEELVFLAMKAVASMHSPHKSQTLRGMVKDAANISGVSATAWMQSRYWDIKRELKSTSSSAFMWSDPKLFHLDELEFLLEDTNKKKSLGLNSRNDLVQAILESAKKFDEGMVSSKRRDLSRLPRNRDEWIDGVRCVLQTQKNFSCDVESIEHILLALRDLNSHSVCVELANNALARNTRVRKASLDEALKAAIDGNEFESISQIQLLLSQRRES